MVDVKTAPAAQQVAGNAEPLTQPTLLPLTYGSWMELGLAARQMTANLITTEKLPKRRRRDPQQG